MVLAVAIAIPVAVAIGVVALIATGLWKLFSLGYYFVQPDPLERELAHTIWHQNAALSDIVALRNEGEREMQRVAGEDIENTTEAWPR